ncbi:hypothetical protein LTR53_002900 [Teratosphaeriaceae sp. CCFEE 6253]|nr:hypothetical protein LTR53_002900 [Teratosphaeriaceae sp. CCFEE 6253]
MSLTMVSSNVAGYTKKQLTGAVVFVGPTNLQREGGTAVGLVPQHISIQKQRLTPSRYHSAYIAILTGYCAKTVLVMVLYAYMWSVNKRRDREAATAGLQMGARQEKEAIEKGMQDMTEIDNHGFRYVL